MTFTHALPSGNYGPAKFIVSANVYEGTHTTIAAALSAASSGDTIFVRPGTYTENLTAKAGVNLVAFGQDSLTPNVTIIGKITFTAAGTFTIANIRLQTNSDFFLAVTGSAASIVLLDRCYLNCSNNTGISITTSSSSAQIICNNCEGNIGTTGISLFSSSSAGFLGFQLCNIQNSGGSTTASTISAGSVNINNCVLAFPITTSSTAAIIIQGLQIAATNTTCLTVGGSTASQAEYMVLNSGTASGISIGAGANLALRYSRITSSNANAITGAGTLTGTANTFSSTTTINPTTQTPESIGPTNINRTQPAFLAVLQSNDSNVTGNNATYVVGTNVAYTEVFDQANNFSGTTFTAPYTGRYLFNLRATFNGITTATSFELFLTTTARLYNEQISGIVAPAGGNYTLAHSAFADMTAGDTATMSVRANGQGANTVDLLGDTIVYTAFSGFLVC